ncbi:MAG: hypothetical protein KBD64_06100 [Gammaproteobacteria bacterium]|nr:hypothetical protein [Gammaproteobacteria bacterium]
MLSQPLPYFSHHNNNGQPFRPITQQVQLPQVQSPQVQHVFDSQSRMWHEATLVNSSLYHSNTGKYYQVFRLNQLILDPMSQQLYHKTVYTEVIFNPATQQKYNRVVPLQLYANQNYTQEYGGVENGGSFHNVNNNRASTGSNYEGYKNQVTPAVANNIPSENTISNQTVAKKKLNGSVSNSNKNQSNQHSSVNKQMPNPTVAKTELNGSVRNSNKNQSNQHSSVNKQMPNPTVAKTELNGSVGNSNKNQSNQYGLVNKQMPPQAVAKTELNGSVGNSNKNQSNQPSLVTNSNKSNRLDQFDKDNAHFVMSGPAELMSSLNKSFTKKGVPVAEKNNATNNVTTITTRYNDNRNRQIINLEPGSPRTNTPRVLTDHHSKKELTRTYTIRIAYGDMNNIEYTKIVNGDTALAADAYANLPKAHLAMYSTQTLDNTDIDQLQIAIGEVKKTLQIIPKEQSFTLKPGIGTLEQRALTQTQVMGGQSATNVARQDLDANINFKPSVITPESQQCLDKVLKNTNFQWRHLKPFSEFGNASQEPGNLTAGTAATNAIDNIFEIALKQLVDEQKKLLNIYIGENCIKNPNNRSLRADVSIERDTIILNPENKRFCIMNYNTFAISKPPHKTIMAVKELLRPILFPSVES